MVLAIHFFPFEAGHYAEKETEKADRSLVLGAGGAFGLCCLCISCLYEKKKKKKCTWNRDQEPGVFSLGQVSLLQDNRDCRSHLKSSASAPSGPVTIRHGEQLRSPFTE